MSKPKDKFSDLFVKDADEYVRDVNVYKHYVDDAAFFLSKCRNVSLDAAREFVLRNIKPGGAFAFKDPTIEFMQRQENGDRIKVTAPLSRYIGAALKNEDLIAPTFTTYVNPKVYKSLQAEYIEEAKKARSRAKKAMFVARADKDHVLEAVKEVEQKGRKLAANALSGAFVSASTPLVNKTAHSTLTSTCRTTSGYGNANNEKFIMGNRHYFSPRIVMNNIVSITNHTDYVKLEKVLNTRQLHYPSVEEVMQVIEYSSGLYWWAEKSKKIIQSFVEKLSALERAAFVYVGDAYQLRRFNDQFMREFIRRLSSKVKGTHPNPMEVLKKSPDPYINLAHQICTEETKGIGKKYERIADSEKIHTLALTVEAIADTVWDYRDVIEALWMTNNLPAAVGHFPCSIRRSAMTSDTDSTIFTVQDWVSWYSHGEMFNENFIPVTSAVVFLAASTITHVLATMSANFGIAKDKLFDIAMKSEFTFPVFVPTQLGKHYYAAISCQEGNVNEHLEYEIKGVNLKNATTPKKILNRAHDMLKDIIATTLKGEKIQLTKYLKIVADTEREIMQSIKDGNLEYLRNSSIKDSGSYSKDPEESPYNQHFFWQEVFAPKYGEMPKPPYGTKKFAVNLGNNTKLKKWVESISDEEFKQRLITYLDKNEKTHLNVMYLPTDIVAWGIPEEVKSVINLEKIALDLTRIFKIILETCGYYSSEDRLVSQNGW